VGVRIGADRDPAPTGLSSYFLERYYRYVPQFDPCADLHPGADSEEKHEPVSDIDTAVVDSLKALDPEWPIREADILRSGEYAGL
jgi:hypothetical protein